MTRFITFRKPSTTGRDVAFQEPHGTQQFLYQPGRAMPLVSPVVADGSATVKTSQRVPDQSLHIWEQPLPEPGKGSGTSTTQASGYCPQGSFPTLPYPGTGTTGSGQAGSDTASWAGTQEVLRCWERMGCCSKQLLTSYSNVKVHLYIKDCTRAHWALVVTFCVYIMSWNICFSSSTYYVIIWTCTRCIWTVKDFCVGYSSVLCTNVFAFVHG